MAHRFGRTSFWILDQDLFLNLNGHSKTNQYILMKMVSVCIKTWFQVDGGGTHSVCINWFKLVWRFES